MIYAHVLDRGQHGVPGPADRLLAGQALARDGETRSKVETTSGAGTQAPDSEEERRR